MSADEARHVAAMVKYPDSSHPRIAPVRGVQSTINSENRAMRSLGDRSNFVACTMNSEGLCQYPPLLTIKTKFEQKIGLAATVRMIGHKQIVPGFRYLNPGVFRVRQSHA